MSDIQVLIRKKCTLCRNGLVQSPLWKEYWSSHTPKQDTDEEMLRWFADRGYLQESKPLMGLRCNMFPPEEIPCPDCFGATYLEYWEDLETLLKPYLKPLCEAEACDYFTHYLRRGGANIPHHAYHKAVKECLEMEAMALEYEAKGKDVPIHIKVMCEKLEKEVRA